MVSEQITWTAVKRAADHWGANLSTWELPGGEGFEVALSPPAGFHWKVNCSHYTCRLLSFHEMVRLCQDFVEEMSEGIEACSLGKAECCKHLNWETPCLAPEGMSPESFEEWLIAADLWEQLGNTDEAEKIRRIATEMKEGFDDYLEENELI